SAPSGATGGWGTGGQKDGRTGGLVVWMLAALSCCLLGLEHAVYRRPVLCTGVLSCVQASCVQASCVQASCVQASCVQASCVQASCVQASCVQASCVAAFAVLTLQSEPRPGVVSSVATAEHAIARR
uniref:Uncharacterized protein n=1 Tax=Salarias fasciatus TaxID=181472 RepID=A0A672HZH9_SALFA